MIASTTLTQDWKIIIDQLPDDKPAPVPQPESVYKTPPKPVIPGNVLYDFGKDVEAMFTVENEKLKQIITDFRTTRLPSRRHSTIRHFSEDVLDLLIERYDFVASQLSSLLKKLEAESDKFQAEYDSDMKKLDITYQYSLSNSNGEADLAAKLNQVDAKRSEMTKHYEELQGAVIPMLNALLGEYYTKNPPLFTERLELAPAQSTIWRAIPRQEDEIQKTFYMGEKSLQCNILQESLELRKRMYVQSLYGGNVLLFT